MKAAVAALSISLFLSCTNQKQELTKAEWLVGTWENKTEESSLYETWTKINDDELAGKSYTLEGNDTIEFETIRIVQELDSIFFIPTVKDQNQGLPVRFVMKTISDTGLIFENPQHDFPQVITYTKINNDSLVAEVSGEIRGKISRQTFSMKKVK